MNSSVSDVKRFCSVNGHAIERYVNNKIFKELDKCAFIYKYNSTYDLILYYKNRE